MRRFTIDIERILPIIVKVNWILNKLKIIYRMSNYYEL